MKLLRQSGSLFLEHEGRSVAVDATDLFHLVRMTPLGRKVYFRNKAKEILLHSGPDESARILIEWYLLPAQDWSFGVPPEISPSD